MCIQTLKVNSFKVNSFCVPPDAYKKHHCCADCPVGHGALHHHQLCRPGDQGSEEQREERRQGKVDNRIVADC